MWDADVYAPPGAVLSDDEIQRALAEGVLRLSSFARRILLLPPDFTRLHSRAGEITAYLYRALSAFAQVDVLPALGTHAPMTQAQCETMFAGAIPYSSLLTHDWRQDVVQIGCVPAEFVAEVSEGLVRTPIAVEVNRRLLDPSYDCILSIGQVVPHEVVGMANQSKNLFVGCGGSGMINASHMLGAFYGLERLMGRDHSPVRRVFDYAQDHFLQNLPLCYLLTVCTDAGVRGLFIGRSRAHFEKAVALSQRENITLLHSPLRKAVVYLDPDEYQSTWLGNKAVYRTRMAMADGGELLILAPGVKRFGEDAACDRLIRRYGYCGRQRILRLCEEDAQLQGNLSAAAHLIHGSSDGRFRVTYCTQHLSSAEVEGVGYGWMPYAQACALVERDRLLPGYNTLSGGEEVYYIDNPALGLWALQAMFS